MIIPILLITFSVFLLLTGASFAFLGMQEINSSLGLIFILSGGICGILSLLSSRLALSLDQEQQEKNK